MKIDNKVIHKFTLLEAENGQFRRDRPSNGKLGMKILQNQIIGTQTRFSTNFGGKLSLILCFSFFLSASTAATYIFTAPTTHLYIYYNYSRTLYIKC